VVLSMPRVRARTTDPRPGRLYVVSPDSKVPDNLDAG
jgi:hypothetical protein